jgi:hypothetical protein
MLRVIAATMLMTLCHQGQAAPAEKNALTTQAPVSIRSKVVSMTSITGLLQVSSGAEFRRVLKFVGGK